MSGDIITNDTKTRNFTIQLSTNCDIFGNKIFINKADVVDLQPAKEKKILGLDFIVHDNISVTITKDYLLISTNSQMSPIIDELTSELRTKHDSGGITMLCSQKLLLIRKILLET